MAPLGRTGSTMNALWWILLGLLFLVSVETVLHP